MKCQYSTIIKHKRIKLLEHIINRLQTPKVLIITIQAGTMVFYNNTQPHSHAFNVYPKIMER